MRNLFQKKLSFIHEGPTEIIINSSKILNRNLFVTDHLATGIQMPNSDNINSFVERVRAVYIDSSRNGISNSKELKKDILIVNSEINQLSLNEKKYYDSDSPFKIDDYVNKLERRKKRIEKRLDKIPLIQIKILTR